MKTDDRQERNVNCICSRLGFVRPFLFFLLPFFFSAPPSLQTRGFLYCFFIFMNSLPFLFLDELIFPLSLSFTFCLSVCVCVCACVCVRALFLTSPKIYVDTHTLLLIMGMQPRCA